MRRFSGLVAVSYALSHQEQQVLNWQWDMDCMNQGSQAEQIR